MADDIAISVDKVRKEFLLPHEQNNTIKSKLINFAKKTKYEHQVALDGVSFEVKKGEFFGIVGRNGSGKSTLLKILAGIYQPDKGAVHVNGRLTPFIELGVGFNPELSGRDNVFLNGALLSFSRKEMTKLYSKIVEFAELERFMDQKLKNYSSGMQVRLAFAIAIQAKSDVLLLDEVLAVGDAAFQQKCYTYFENLKAKKETVVFVSHDMDAIRRFCTKAAYIEKGKITEIGDASEIAIKYTERNINKQLESTEKANPELLKNSIILRRTNRSSNSVELAFEFKSHSKEDLFVGMSIIKDGISIAEISTERELSLKGKGSATYQFTTENLNAGVYKVTAALFVKSNRELIGVAPKAITFEVNGYDTSRGAALKLPDGWKVSREKN